MRNDLKHEMVRVPISGVQSVQVSCRHECKVNKSCVMRETEETDTRSTEVSGGGIATIIENGYMHLDRSPVVARVGMSRFQIILWASS
jgi:hypothetical protein